MKFKTALLTLVLSKVAFASGSLEFENMHNVPMQGKLRSSPNSTAQARQDAAGGQVRTGIKLQSWHSVNMYNDTDHNQDYNYTFKMCADQKGCVEKSFNVTLNPGQNYQDSKNLNSNVAYYKTGSYGVSAETSINGEHSDNQKSYNTINVYN